jgi:hypothetical protein
MHLRNSLIVEYLAASLCSRLSYRDTVSSIRTRKIRPHLVMYSGRERFAFNVQVTADDQMDSDFPVKYKLLAYLKPVQKTGAS